MAPEEECSPAQAKEGRQGPDDANLDGYEAHEEGEHNVPLMQQQAHVHAGTRCHKEEPQKHSPERPDVSFHLP